MGMHDVGYADVKTQDAALPRMMRTIPYTAVNSTRHMHSMLFCILSAS